MSNKKTADKTLLVLSAVFMKLYDRRLVFLVFWFWCSTRTWLIQEEILSRVVLINTVNLGRSLQRIRKPKGIHTVFAVAHLIGLHQALLL